MYLVGGALEHLCDRERLEQTGTLTIDQAKLALSDMLWTFYTENPDMTPIGATMLWHTYPPPDRWLILDGSGWLETDYPELFALWGHKYGGGGGFFAVPNMGSKSPYGVGGTVGLDVDFGSETHTLTPAEIPSHTHGGIVTAGNQIPARGVVGSGSATLVTMSGITVGGGGGGDHNNMHPVFGVYYIVYAGKP